MPIEQVWFAQQRFEQYGEGHMTRMTPSEAFVETLAANNVDTTFGIMGSVSYTHLRAHETDS